MILFHLFCYCSRMKFTTLPPIFVYMSLKLYKKKRNRKKRDAMVFTEDGKAYEVPVEGSLGLLAAGYKGIMLWRHKRWEEKNKTRNTDKILPPQS